MPEDSLSPKARHSFTVADQVNQLVGASEAVAFKPHAILWRGFGPPREWLVLATGDAGDDRNVQKRREIFSGFPAGSSKQGFLGTISG